MLLADGVLRKKIDSVSSRRHYLNYKFVALKILGIIWLLDGILQFQPYMFSNKFVTNILENSAQGQPYFVNVSVMNVAKLVGGHIVFWNLLFALIQLGIGVGILIRKTEKVALVISFVWAFGVWWFGEAFGQIFSGNATLLTGAPGAVILYGIIGLILWPTDKMTSDTNSHFDDTSSSPTLSISEKGILSKNLIKSLWALVWVLDGVLQILPINSSKGVLVSVIKSQATGEPSVFAYCNNMLANLIHQHGVAVAISLGIFEILIGVGIFLKNQNLFLILGMVFALVTWVGVQDMGGIFTGQGTDPNLGPLLILFAFCLYKFKSEKYRVTSVVTMQKPKVLLKSLTNRVA